MCLAFAALVAVYWVSAGFAGTSVRSPFALARASLVVERSYLDFSISTRSSWRSQALTDSAVPGTGYFNVDLIVGAQAANPATAVDHVYLSVTWERKRSALIAIVTTNHGKNLSEVAHAEATKVGPNTLRVRVRRAAIGAAKRTKLDWRVLGIYAGCGAKLCMDSFPRHGFIATELH